MAKKLPLEAHRKQVQRMMLRNGLYPEELDARTIQASGYTDTEVGFMLLNEEPELYHTIAAGAYTKNEELYTETIVDTEKETKVTYKNMELSFIIPQHIHDRITALVDTLGKESLEIGGLLKGKRVGNTILVTDSITLPQEVGGADFDIKEETVAAWAMEHMDEPDFNEWTGWWHSHHTMGLFWSGTDDAMFAKLLGDKKEYSECFGIVYIVGGKHLARMDIKTGYMGLTIDNIPTTVVGEKRDAADISAEAEATINACVTRPKATSYKSITFGRSLKDEQLISDEELYKKISYPWNCQELKEYYEIHSKVLNNWTLELECAIWGINYGS